MSRVAMGACPAPTFALGEAKLCLLIQIKEINAIKHMDKLENRFSVGTLDAENIRFSVLTGFQQSSSAELIPVEF